MSVFRIGLTVSTWFAAAWFGLAGTASAQIPLYAQRLPEGTVYIRLVNALPGAVTIKTDFVGIIGLGADGETRVSPYFVDVTGGGKTIALKLTEGGKPATATFQPQSGTFVTIVLHRNGEEVTASLIADKPEYNQLRARLAFYNATADCMNGSLKQAAGPAIFDAIAPDTAVVRSINPVSASVTAGCTTGRAPPVDLGNLEAGGLYTVWMMRPAGNLIAFVAHDTIAPPRS